MTKMEALKDVKKTLDSVINKLETYIFIQNIDNIRENESNKGKEVRFEIK